ncbi:MAG: FAD-dependent oxidoreductase [Nanoarchaeota archaeon]|nr:FAD-dependent oxidoreductase [Nanoarchaeota archaeon]
MKEEVFWKNQNYIPRKQLKKDLQCDYLIVGGGITGVSIAYFLALNGIKNVALIEKNHIGSGATGKSAGFLALKGELDLTQIIHKYGRKRGLIYWKGNHDGLKIIRDIISKENIRCDFELQPTIYGSIAGKKDSEVLGEYILEKDIEKDTELLVGKKLRKEVNTPLFEYAIKSYDHGASLNPLKFIQDFSKVVEKKGVRVYESTPLLKIKQNIALTPHGNITFRKAILAIDAANRSSKIKNLRSTIVITNKLTKKQLKSINLLQHKMIWDSEDIYHYLKITKDNRILLGYGDKQVHKRHKIARIHHPHIKRITIFLKKLFPHLSPSIEYAWSGDFGVTEDKIPVIEFKGNKVMVGGASSQIVCVMSAKHIVHKLLHKKSSLEEFFNPG